jgi:DNA-binding transcriptional ArsR family regulator
MKVQAVSNQLQLLAARGIVSSRRDGTSVLYRLDDPCIATLLDRGWCLAEDSTLRKK